VLDQTTRRYTELVIISASPRSNQQQQHYSSSIRSSETIRR